jgi:hypothetical protein
MTITDCDMPDFFGMEQRRSASKGDEDDEDDFDSPDPDEEW